MFSQEVAGNHSAIYEACYNMVDPNGFGTVGGMEAARFLKRSGLSDVILSKIWDLSDPGGRGCLDKSGMFVALKLVALVQNGRDLSINNVNEEVPPPKMGDIPLPKPAKPRPPSTTPLITSLPPSAVDWTIKPMEREKYDNLFDSLQPTNGLIPGNKVKNVLMESKLPLDTLGKIWDLADQDKDGMLNRHEFVVAMHLVYKALEKYAIPNTLPPELTPQHLINKRNGSITTSTPIIPRGLDGIKPEVPPPPLVSAPPPLVAAHQPLVATQPAMQPAVVPKPVQSVQPTVPWVVSADEKSKSDMLFLKSDVDKDGFVSGLEIKDVFLQSGVPQPVLAHIWALCDIKQSGKLNNEQFALAMWFVSKCLKGIEPPAALTPEMVPPSFRITKPKADGLVENNNSRYSNPELDMISKDIEELCKEKLALETDIAQKEADIKIKSGEIKNLQSELDTLAATLKQLENQKGEAQKRLNDLKAQKTEVDTEMEEFNGQFTEGMEKVDKLRTQAAEQAELVASQEAELNSKKLQLEGLRQEEQRLEQQKADSIKKLDNLSTSLQDTQLNISQAKALITQLQEQTRQINDAISLCDTAITSGDANVTPESILRIEPDFRNPEYIKVGMVNGDTNKQNGFDGDPFSNQNGNTTNAGFQDDPFKSEPFKSKDAFSSNDPFSAAFPKSNDGFSSDPFGGSFVANTTTKEDPFDAFGSRKNSEAAAVTEPDKDPFGCDPFAVLHAPTRDGTAPPRPTSPSPALPPKKSKQPPPRPAPPRPMAPPAMKKATTDAFGSVNDPFGGGGGGFADFTDFDAKCLHRNYHVIPILSPSHNSPFQKSFLTFFPDFAVRFDFFVAYKFSNSAPKSTTNIITNVPLKSTSAPTIQVTRPASTAAGKTGLDFTDDPFRDYRYEDPFNITFDDDNDDVTQTPSSDVRTKSSTSSLDAFGLSTDGISSSTAFSFSSPSKLDDKFDPFGLGGGGRQSVPLPLTSQKWSSSSRIGGGSSTSVNSVAPSGRVSAPLVKSGLLSEQDQFELATMESLWAEEDRQKRALQEQADLELAIRLSKVDTTKRH